MRNRSTSPKDKDRHRNASLVHFYGITLERFNELFVAQKGLCAICGIHQSQTRTALCVDHDHVTGKIRGLLCHKCNSCIGSYVWDDPQRKETALKYLRS